jgi:hypothetical protein
VRCKSAFIKSVLKKSEAFTLIELVVTMAISIVVVMGTAHLSTIITKQMKNLHINSALIEDNALLRKVVIKDLLHAGPSFDFLIEDEFDVIGDNPPASIDNFWKSYGKEEADFSVVVVLQSAGDYFYILKTDNSLFDGDGDGVFEGKRAFFVNPVSISNSAGTLVRGKMEDELATIWEADHHLKFKALTRIEDREYAFLIKIDQNTTVPDNFCGQQEFSCQPPSTLRCSVSNIANLNQYLGCLPVQGAFANVLVSPVELVRYELRASPRKSEPGLRVYRIVEGREQLIATRVRWISFARNDLSDTIVSMSSRFYKVLDRVQEVQPTE